MSGAQNRLYLIEIRDGRPTLMGPYDDWEYRRKVAREMMVEGREVYWLDTSGNVSVGRHFRSDET